MKKPRIWVGRKQIAWSPRGVGQLCECGRRMDLLPPSPFAVPVVEDRVCPGCGLPRLRMWLVPPADEATDERFERAMVAACNEIEAIRKDSK